MNTFIGALSHVLSWSDKIPIIILLLFLIYGVILTIFYKKYINDNKKIKQIRLLSLLPLIISIIYFIIRFSGAAYLILLIRLIPLLLPSIFIILMFLFKKKTPFIIMKVFTYIIFFISLFLSIDSFGPINYTRLELKNAYIKLCDYMDNNYILSDWKKIDYDKIKEHGLSLIDKYYETNDINYYYKAIDDFVISSHDGHMGIFFYDDNVSYSIDRIKDYNDYGLSIIKTTDGNYIAVNVDDRLKSLGLYNGIEVIKWNGLLIEDAIKDVNVILPFSVKENEDITKTIMLTSTSEEAIIVVRDEDVEKEVKLEKLDSKYPRWVKTLNIFLHDEESDNYSTKMLSDDIGYIKITEEGTDAFHDVIGYLSKEHKYAKEMFRSKLHDLKDKGMKKLVIDIRNNAGGFDEIATSLASLFSNETYFAFNLGKYKDGKYIKCLSKYVYKDGEFSDLDIIVITNMRCASAGDGMVKYLSKLPNVQVVGLTDPEGINQETGGIIFLPKGIGISFPIGLILDEDGNPNIDTDYTLESRNKVIKLPFTKEVATKMYNDKDYDYELDWVINYFNSKTDK